MQHSFKIIKCKILANMTVPSLFCDLLQKDILTTHSNMLTTHPTPTYSTLSLITSYLCFGLAVCSNQKINTIVEVNGDNVVGRSRFFLIVGVSGDDGLGRSPFLVFTATIPSLLLAFFSNILYLLAPQVII